MCREEEIEVRERDRASVETKRLSCKKLRFRPSTGGLAPYRNRTSVLLNRR